MPEQLPPSMLHSTLGLPSHFWSWLILIILLGIGCYTLKVIITEKSNYEAEGLWFNWQELSLFLPQWWSILKQSELEVIFHRQDTHYDWKWSIKKITAADIVAAEKNFFQERKIELDDDAVVTQEKNYLFVEPNSLQKIRAFKRIEGTGTETQEERIYLDLAWIKIASGSVYQFASISSVLNGGIEGPFVEESLKKLVLLC